MVGEVTPMIEPRDARAASTSRARNLVDFGN